METRLKKKDESSRYTDTERRLNKANDRLRELGLPTLGEHTAFFKLLRAVDKMLKQHEEG